MSDKTYEKGSNLSSHWSVWDMHLLLHNPLEKRKCCQSIISYYHNPLSKKEISECLLQARIFHPLSGIPCNLPIMLAVMKNLMWRIFQGPRDQLDSSITKSRIPALLTHFKEIMTQLATSSKDQNVTKLTNQTKIL